jgi:hypothetical protein
VESTPGTPGPPFEQLDFLYVPSRDVAADLAFFATALGGRILFAIRDGGTRVAAVELTTGPPLLLLADHLRSDRPILIYRVGDLAAAVDALASRGWQPERALEIPPGPCRTLRGPGGHHVAVYQRTRPDVIAHFEDRFDFDPAT